MLKTFSAAQVTADVLAHLERRRPAIVHDDAAIRVEIAAALEPVRREYAEMDLPIRYLDALEREIQAALPARWRQFAEPFTADELRNFGIWRGGDVLARLGFLGIAAAIGFFVVWAPFIPIWEKWLPFALGAGAWWLPDLQVRFKRRRYARQLGEIVLQMNEAQRQIERQVTAEDILAGAQGVQSAPAPQSVQSRSGVDRLKAAAGERASERAPERAPEQAPERPNERTDSEKPQS